MFNWLPPRLPMIHDQQLLTLRWRSFSWWGREGIAICFAYNGSQKVLYDWLQPISGVISQDAWPKFVDALLTLIFRMWQGGYCNLFCLSRWPKIALWLSATYQQCDFPGRMIKNRWRSVDPHFQDEVGSISLYYWPYRRPILRLCITTRESILNFQTYMIYNCWRSVDAHFAMAVSTIFNHFIWHSPSFTLFWHLFWRFHLLSSWSLRCSLKIHSYI